MRASVCAAIMIAWAGMIVAAPTRAAGPFDGTWVFDIQASAVTGGNTTPTCPSLRFATEIRDSRITGELERGYSGGVQSGSGSSASPVSGSVQADGTLTVEWQNYHASGQLAGDAGRITVQSQCGPRAGTVTRVAK